jgi:chemotaxis protein histidine kinase CheA
MATASLPEVPLSELPGATSSNMEGAVQQMAQLSRLFADTNALAIKQGIKDNAFPNRTGTLPEQWTWWAVFYPKFEANINARLAEKKGTLYDDPIDQESNEATWAFSQISKLQQKLSVADTKADAAKKASDADYAKLADAAASKAANDKAAAEAAAKQKALDDAKRQAASAKSQASSAQSQAAAAQSQAAAAAAEAKKKADEATAATAAAKAAEEQKSRVMIVLGGVAAAGLAYFLTKGKK